MHLLAAALAFANSPQNRPIVHAGATAQAIATVRIISGAVIHLGEGPRGCNGPLAQDTIVHTEGAVHRARLIEFE